MSGYIILEGRCKTNHVVTTELLKHEGLTEEIKQWITTTLNKHLHKTNATLDDLGTYEHIIDYLKSSQAPKRLRKMSYQQAINLTQKWTRVLEKRGNNIRETSEDIKVVKKFRKTGFSFVKLVGKRAFEREGAQMRHCVASYYGKDNCEVYSLRDPLNNSHCTIEVVVGGSGKSRQVQQIKGKGNGPIHPDYIFMVIDILKYFKIPVRSSEMSNLGYMMLSKEEEKIIDRFYPEGLQKIEFSGNTYLYKNQNFD